MMVFCHGDGSKRRKPVHRISSNRSCTERIHGRSGGAASSPGPCSCSPKVEFISAVLWAAWAPGPPLFLCHCPRGWGSSGGVTRALSPGWALPGAAGSVCAAAALSPIIPGSPRAPRARLGVLLPSPPGPDRGQEGKILAVPIGVSMAQLPAPAQAAAPWL